MEGVRSTDAQRVSLSITRMPCAPTNFRVGRSGHPIIGVVIHIEAGTEVGTDAWFANPLSKVSAHYSVRVDGQVHQYVDEANVAFHCGIAYQPTWWFAQQSPLYLNQATIGIEHEGVADVDITEDQYGASSTLLADICRRNSIPLDPLHVVPHHAIRASKQCPGLIDVWKLITLAKALNLDGGVPSSTLT